jgi:hypothetical protein
MDSALQLVMDQFKELKSEISTTTTELKSELSATTAELKSDMCTLGTGQEALKSDICALGTGQEALKSDICAELKSDISKIRADL